MKIPLFDRKLASDHLANYLLETICQCPGTHGKYWQMSMQDCAATNMAALWKTEETFQHTSPLEAYCAMHGLSNASKKLKESAPYAAFKGGNE
eukprot:3529891-Ditylum_brightwellii.AAC.1